MTDLGNLRSNLYCCRYFLRQASLSSRLMQALVDSLYYTDQSSRTSLYVVNDYCYYMWWLAAAASKDPEAESPLTFLLEASTDRLLTLS